MSLRDFLFHEEPGITLYCGDCRKVLPLLASEPVDLLVTDPPYSSAMLTATSGRAKQKWGGNWGDMSLTVMLAEMVLDHVRQPGLQTLWFCDHVSYAALFPSFFRRFSTVQNIVWDKDTLGLGAYFRKQTELILYARTADSPPPARKDMRDIIRLRPTHAHKEHPTEKPLDLIRLLIEPLTWTLALDPFVGSGSALLAAKMLDRPAIGIEIEPQYCEIAVKRLKRLER